MTDRRLDEYSALRDTIRTRGTARLVLLPLVFVGWAATVIATAAVITVALSTLVPLMVLAAGFEAIYALHVNVERIGRYLEVFHEDGEGWEHVVSRLRQGHGSTGADPLFGRLFVFATSINYLPAALGGELIEWVLLAVLHFAFIYRIRSAQGALARQRDEELERFRQLRGNLPQG